MPLKKLQESCTEEEIILHIDFSENINANTHQKFKASISVPRKNKFQNPKTCSTQ